MPKKHKNDSGGGQEGRHKRPLWLAFCMSVALSMGSSPHLAKSKSPLQKNLHICKISGTSGSANPLAHPTEWRLYANQFQTISQVLIWKHLVTIELATNISLKIRIGCSVTWSYLVHHTPLVNAHHPLAATYSLQNVYSVKSWRKRYLGGPKGAPSFQCSRRKAELLGSRRRHLLHLNLWRWEMGVCIAQHPLGLSTLKECLRCVDSLMIQGAPKLVNTGSYRKRRSRNLRRLFNIQSQQFVTSAIPSLQQTETTSTAWRLEPLCPLKSSWMCYVLRLPGRRLRKLSFVTASLTVPLMTCSLNPSRGLSWKQWTPATKWSS